MAQRLERGLMLAVIGMVLLGNGPVANANHRRGAYGPCHGHCQFPVSQVAQALPAYAMPAYSMPSAVAVPQAAAIPPALVPILMTVGSDVAGLAAQKLLELIHNRLGGGLPTPLPPTPNDGNVVPNADLTALETRLEALEKKVGATSPTPVDVRKGSVATPDGKPAQFPRFLYPQ
jgi:hypothetical protein